jgi:hypothetical protein
MRRTPAEGHAPRVMVTAKVVTTTTTRDVPGRYPTASLV